MPSAHITALRGLETNPSPLIVDPGGFSVFDNFVKRRPGVAECRRGIPQVGNGIASGTIQRLFGWGANNLLAFNGTTFYNSADVGSTWTALTGSFAGVSATVPVRAAEAVQDLYITTSTGVQRLDAAAGAPMLAGAAPGLDLQVTQKLNGTNSGWMAGDGQVAYRCVWGYKDANGRRIIDEPSGRCIVTSPGWTAAAGKMSKAAGTSNITVTDSTHPFVSADVGTNIVVGPGETNFAPGTYSLTAVTAGVSFAYTDGLNNGGGSAVLNVLPERFCYGTRDTNVEVTIPSTATSSMFVQVHRSGLSVQSSVDPDDDVQLVYEASPPPLQTGVSLTRTAGTTVTATQNNHPYVVGQTVYLQTNSANFPQGFKVITSVTTNTFVYAESGSNVTEGTKTFSAVTMYFTDSVPEALLGEFLYSDPSQEGISASNNKPPLSWDLCLFHRSMFYGNTAQTHNTTVTAVAALQAADTVTIDGVTYTAGSSEVAYTGQFKVATGGSVSQNIANTIASLVRVINRYPSSTVFAKHLIADNDPTTIGQFYVWRKAYGGSAFTATSSRPASFLTALPVTSTASAALNGLMFSKPDKPDAVPLANFLPIGAANQNILRLLATRDSLFVFKEDGLFRVTGEYPEWRVEEFDRTVHLVAPETAALVDKKIYGLCRAGVAAITESGVNYVSGKIEDALRPILATTGYISTLQQYSFGFGYDSTHEYYMAVTPISYVPLSQGGYANALGIPTAWYCYNSRSDEWSTGSFASGDSLQCGKVPRFADVICMGTSLGVYMRRESKGVSGSNAGDTADGLIFSVSANNAGGGGTRVLTSAGASGIVAGDIISPSGTGGAWIVSLVNGNNITITGTITSTGQWVVYKPINVSATFLPITGGTNMLEQFNEIQIDRLEVGGSESVTCTTDYTGTAVPFTANNAGFAAGISYSRNFIPVESCRGSQLVINLTSAVKLATFQLAGVEVKYRDVSTKVGSG